MTDLVDAYQRDELDRYQAILDGHPDVLADSFIAENIDEVTRNIRTRAMLRLIRPYSRFRLAWVAQRLHVSEAEAEDILCHLITDGKVHAKIYQPEGTVLVENEAEREEAVRWSHVREWMRALEALSTQVLEEGEGFQPDDYGSGASLAEALSPRHGAAGRPEDVGRGGGGSGSGSGLGSKLFGRLTDASGRSRAKIARLPKTGSKG